MIFCPRHLYFKKNTIQYPNQRKKGFGKETVRSLLHARVEAHLPANYMVSNNFSFPMTMEGRGGDRLLSKVNNNHHKHRKEGKESGKHIQLIE
jgi:hypothetical protein